MTSNNYPSYNEPMLPAAELLNMMKGYIETIQNELHQPVINYPSLMIAAADLPFIVSQWRDAEFERLTTR